MIPIGIIAAVLFSNVPSVSGSDITMLQEEYNGITSADYFDPEEYQVGFGDQIWISFPGGVPFARSEESVSTIVLPVGLDGILSVPGMPPISVSGLNLSDLQVIIENMVRSSYGSFAVTSGLARSASFEIPVTGQVRQPGITAVNGLTRLSEVISEAGGATATAAMSNVLVVQSPGDSSHYDLNAFTLHGDMASNPLMRRNTRVHVFPSESTIILEGALSSLSEEAPQQAQQPSSMLDSQRMVVEYIPEETPGEALRRIGGASEAANVSSCFVQRRADSGQGYEMLPFDLGRSSEAFVMAPGDRIVVPFAERFINVVGEVRSPVPVAYSPGMTVNYYIGMAGGFLQTARRNSIKLVSPDGESHEAELTTIVPQGTTVEVPRVAVHFWQEYLTILTGVATVVISYQSLFQ